MRIFTLAAVAVLALSGTALTEPRPIPSGSIVAAAFGHKWGRAAGAGLLAVLLAVAKKAWFLLILPFLLIGRLFRRS